MHYRRLSSIVEPFYLAMMGTGAADVDDKLMNTFTKVGHSTTADEVSTLLRSSWRECVMGAWYSLLHEANVVGDDVLLALRGSRGRLSSPSLSVSAVVLLGPSALPAMTHYISNDLANGWGACGFVATAAEHLGANIECEPRESDRVEFAALLSTAAAIRSGRR